MSEAYTTSHDIQLLFVYKIMSAKGIFGIRHLLWALPRGILVCASSHRSTGARVVSCCACILSGLSAHSCCVVRMAGQVDCVWQARTLWLPVKCLTLLGWLSQSLDLSLTEHWRWWFPHHPVWLQLTRMCQNEWDKPNHTFRKKEKLIWEKLKL